MVRSRNDYNTLRRPGATYLQTTSYTFGLADGQDIERSFLAAGRNLRRTLLRLVDGLATGSIGLQGFSDSATAAIFKAYYHAYSLGAISIFPFYTMTDRDVRILNAELYEEATFLKQFGRDIQAGTAGLDPISRSRLYLLALRGIFERGRVEAMPPGPYRWRLGITEHCLDCYQAAQMGPYQRDRQSGLGLPPLPGAPGDGSVCRGLTRCGCRIELASGIPLPNEDLADRMRGLLLEVVNGSRTAVAGSATD